LPELPIQYADFAAWQREVMEGDVLDQELAFWRGKLAGFAPIDFPGHPPGASGAPPSAGAFRFELAETLDASIRAMSHKEAVTPFMALLAGWKIFLARYSGHTDIGVSSPISGRTRAETDSLIGPLLNTLLLRTSLAGNPIVRDTLHRVRDTALEAFTHQDLPFETILDDLQPAPVAGKNPLLRVMFVLMNGEEKTWRTPDAFLEPLTLAEPPPRFDLMLRLRDTGRAITGALVYDQSLFAPDAVERIAAQYEGILSAMAAHPGLGIESLQILPSDEPTWARQSPDWPQSEREAPINELKGPSLAQPPDFPQAVPASPTLDDPALTAHIPAGSPPSQENPATWMESTLADIWQDILNRRPIAVTDDFFELGGNSLLAIRMLVEAEKRTGIHIAPRLVFEYPTVRQLAIEARHPEARIHSPIVAVQATGSLPPFFFLHGDFVEGGLYCVKMARHLGPDRPFYAIDPHGVHDVPPHSIEEMAAARIELIRQVHPQGPYALGGFCNGGLVAFEMARQLEAAGETVSSLVLISVDGFNAEFSWLDRLIGFFPGPGDRKFRSFLKWRERILFCRAVWQRHLAALATPVPISRQPRRFASKALRIIRRAFSILRSRPAAHGVDITAPEAASIDISLIYHQASKAYVPRPYRGSAHLLWPSDMALRDPYAGWGSVMPQIKLLQVPGGHFSSLQGENLLVVSEKLRTCLLEDQA
jgi:syringomycin synthetase protein SyrE